MPRAGKGERSQLTVRVPMDHGEHYAAEANALGMDMSDYAAYVMARAHGLDLPSWLQPNDRQEVLTESA